MHIESQRLFYWSIIPKRALGQALTDQRAGAHGGRGRTRKRERVKSECGLATGFGILVRFGSGCSSTEEGVRPPGAYGPPE